MKRPKRVNDTATDANDDGDDDTVYSILNPSIDHSRLPGGSQSRRVATCSRTLLFGTRGDERDEEEAEEGGITLSTVTLLEKQRHRNGHWRGGWAWVHVTCNTRNENTISFFSQMNRIRIND